MDYSDSLTEKQWLKAIEDGNFDELDNFASTSRSSKKRKGKGRWGWDFSGIQV